MGFRRRGVNARFSYLPVVLPNGRCTGLVATAILLCLSAPLLLCTIARKKPDIVHCRSYVATAIAIICKIVFPRIKVVFDPRGFWPEEGVVTKRWRENSVTFQGWKRIEAFLFRRSDQVIALSETFRSRVCQIVDGAKCSVIYASVDAGRFVAARQARGIRRKELGFENDRVFVYNGSLHAWHDAPLLAQLYRALARKGGNNKLLVITAHSAKALHEVFKTAGLSADQYRIIAARPAEVPGYLAASDYGLVPLKRFAGGGPMSVVAETMIGTKVAEYLACGLPIIVNRHVGGLRALMDRYRLGIVFDSDHLNGVAEEVKRIEERYSEYQKDCQHVAEQYFSLDEAACAYAQLYRDLVS
jgi:glycosyltransferase involved in cell wall biosynthesis